MQSSWPEACCDAASRPDGGHRQGLPRRARTRRRRLRARARRDPRPRGRERLGQVDAGQDPVRRPPARRGDDPRGRRGRELLEPAPGDRARHCRDQPGADSGPDADRRREHPDGPSATEARRDRLAVRTPPRPPGARRARRRRRPAQADRGAAARAPAGSRGGARSVGVLEGADPRRGHERALRDRDRASARAAAAASRARRRDRVHLAPPARGLQLRLARYGAARRPPDRDSARRSDERGALGADDGRPRDRGSLQQEADRPRRSRARGPQPHDRGRHRDRRVVRREGGRDPRRRGPRRLRQERARARARRRDARERRRQGARPSRPASLAGGGDEGRDQPRAGRPEAERDPPDEVGPAQPLGRVGRSALHHGRVERPPRAPSGG